MIRRFLSQAWLYQKARTAAFNWREFLFFDTGYPIITLVFYCLLAAYSFQTFQYLDLIRSILAINFCSHIFLHFLPLGIANNWL